MKYLECGIFAHGFASACCGDCDNLPAPGVISLEIVEDLQAALEQFRLIAGDLGAEVAEVV